MDQTIPDKLFSELYSDDILLIKCKCLITDIKNKIIMSGYATLLKYSDVIELNGHIDDLLVEKEDNNYKIFEVSKMYQRPYKCKLLNLPKNDKYAIYDIEVEFQNVFLNLNFTFNMENGKFSTDIQPLHTSNGVTFIVKRIYDNKH